MTVSHTASKTRVLDVGLNDVQKINTRFCHVNMPGACFYSLRQFQEGVRMCRERPTQNVACNTFRSVSQRAAPQLPKMRGLYTVRTIPQQEMGSPQISGYSTTLVSPNPLPRHTRGITAHDWIRAAMSTCSSSPWHPLSSPSRSFGGLGRKFMDCDKARGQIHRTKWE